MQRLFEIQVYKVGEKEKGKDKKIIMVQNVVLFQGF